MTAGEPKGRPGDRERSCQGCGDAFWFSREEQTWFAAKGYADPKHCPQCRWARQLSDAAARDGFPEQPPPLGGDEVNCAACGALTRLPFAPTDRRPVYCDDCFRNR